ncbi:CaiF/GrlA family transcriptional regulator [Salmonella enterica subsp. enterica serovar Thompson]|nr:CaiF/GrlA family transcriptional regulator [Salmonella enterica]EBY1098274.1 CaiF/GrlA family transcriptional regulator [Salmonella enterica subsp. enterica serovar Sandiego]ECO1040189.1 CaiF/GrlA family transcriptional regulator [Salmonella enterica subsp. enterica serovar Newport]EDT1690154.1 CaiF/GrlA family transcriptional regulator [Salmonella enterica subsp. enterica serovar Oslo]ECO1043317.1 CaiF/GrlA family transcriptional regulator [Salmonella enterica subsp. enterica serovar Newpor
MNNKLTDNDVQKTIPASVSQYNRQPLYIIIALWCQQQNRWINRNDIAQAFSISVRRASFQLSYITRRQKKIIFRSRVGLISGFCSSGHGFALRFLQTPPHDDALALR